jgi:hypothetical protein
MRYAFAFLLVAGALALAGCGGGGDSSSGTTTTTASGPVTITVEVEDGKPVGGIQKATVEKGETVAIVVHSDVADEVHVHGYDLMKDVPAGGTVRITFPATIAGVFEAELEDRGLQIVEFTVE